MKTYSVGQDEKGHVFVGGNTKYLRDLDQKELAILAKNGDLRVKVEEASEDKKPAKVVAAPTA